MFAELDSGRLPMGLYALYLLVFIVAPLLIIRTMQNRRRRIERPAGPAPSPDEAAAGRPAEQATGALPGVTAIADAPDSIEYRDADAWSGYDSRASDADGGVEHRA